jgi:L-ascorbate metabolism protein UlaG (beta-lactamase superfamily)
LLVETSNKKILIDAGGLKYKEEFFNTWNRADLILFTHWHGDHVNSNVIKNIDAPIYSTLEVQNKYPELKINIIKENDTFNLDNIKIEVVKAVHGYNPLLKDGKEVFENVGYIIDDNTVRLYVTSDTLCFNNNYKADVVALPVTAHGLTMSSFEAALLAKDLEVKLVLPIHMDNEMYPTDLEFMKKNFDKQGINYKVLEIGENIEI